MHSSAAFKLGGSIHPVPRHHAWPEGARRVVSSCSRARLLQHHLPGNRLAGNPMQAGHTQQAECRHVQKLRRQTVPLQRLQASTITSVVPDISNQLTVLQWNLLADGLAQHGDFIKVHPEVLEWQYRKPLILQEILEADADVLCFQELNHYDEVHEALSQHGYTGAFMPKGRSPACKYSSPADGVALFWRQSRLEAVSPPSGFHYLDESGAESAQCCLHVLLREVVTTVDQQQQAGAWAQAVGLNGDSCSIRTDAGSVLQAPRQLQVATTHLKAKEGAGLDQVRTSQMRQLLQGLTDSLERAGSSAPGVACSFAHQAAGSSTHALQCTPVVIAGDFNSVPQSGPCKLLSAHPWNFQSIWDTPVDTTACGDESSTTVEAIGCTTASVQCAADQPHIMNSQQDPMTSQQCTTAPRAVSPAPQQAASGIVAQGHVPNLSSSPSCADVDGLSTLAENSSSSEEYSGEFSTWKFRSGGESKRIIDHLYFSQGAGLVPIRRWRMLTEEEIGGAGLPCARYPSDHIALCCEFEWV